MTRLLLFFSSLSFVLHAQAYEVTGRLSAEQRSFLNQYLPEKSLVPYALEGIEEYVRADRAECKKEARELLHMLHLYQSQSSDGDLIKTNETYRKIRNSLDLNSRCRTAKQRAYLLGSLILTLKPTNPGEPPLPDSNLLSSVQMSYLIFISYLLDQHYIVIGGPRDIQNQKVLGSYDCESTVIDVSLDNRPYDQGSILFHELSHLFRDKLYNEREFLEDFSNDGKGWHNFLLLDESLAVADQIARQASLRLTTLKQNFGSKQEESGDFSFLDWNGPIGRYLRAGPQTNINHILTNAQYETADSNSDYEAVGKRIFSVVQSTYFPGSMPYKNSNRKPVSAYDFDSVGQYIEIRYLQDTDKYPWLEMPPVVSINSENRSFSYRFNLNAYIEMFTWVSQKLEKPSPLCNLFRSASQRHLFDDYIGVKMNDDRLSGEGVKPGISVRPCLLLQGL